MKTTAELSARLELTKNILLSAKDLLLEGFSWTPGSDLSRQQKLAIDTKSNFQDLVTIYDKKVEQHLIHEMNKIFPGEIIIGEESSALNKLSPTEQSQLSDALWVIDPIDGTTNFSRSYPFFCSTISFLMRNSSSVFEPVVGATFNPVSGELFSAFKNGGAWLGRQQLKVSQLENPQSALFTTGFASLRKAPNHRCFEVFSKITHQSLGVRRDGSAALDLAYLAAGRIDGYWEENLSVWDIAAGSLLVQEAGGIVTHHDGKPIDLFQGEILSSTPRLHKWLINKLKEHG